MSDHPVERGPEPSQERTVKLVSIVAIDVVGFSAMSERDQKKTAKKIETLRVRIDATARKHGGRLFNTAGDGFMLEFSSAGAALEAIQDILDKRDKGEPPIRVGAHVGDVIVTMNNDLLGHGVNIAARLQALAAPGSALVSAEFRSMARSSPKAAFQAKGRQPLENIEQKVQTFEILSARQRFTRFVKRMSYGAMTAAVIAGLAFVSPLAFRFVQENLALRGQAEAADPPPPSPAEDTHVQASSSFPLDPSEPALAPGQTFRDCATCPEMVVLPGGLFRMGSPDAEFGRAGDEGPQREVSIAPLAVGKFEITFAEWDACVADGGCNGFIPSDRNWGRGNRPVVGISWADANAYIAWLNIKTSANYRLLSEAEWEYAARGGAESAYAFGDELAPQQATFRARSTAPVGEHPANAFGLFDVHGNAAEWVADCYAPNYELAPINGASVQAETCRERVARGGAYADASAKLRAAARARLAADTRSASMGFRVARPLE